MSKSASIDPGSRPLNLETPKQTSRDEKNTTTQKKTILVALLILGGGGLLVATLGLAGLGHHQAWWSAGSLSHMNSLGIVMMVIVGGGAAVLSLALIIVLQKNMKIDPEIILQKASEWPVDERKNVSIITSDQSTDNDNKAPNHEDVGETSSIEEENLGSDSKVPNDDDENTPDESESSSIDDESEIEVIADDKNIIRNEPSYIKDESLGNDTIDPNTCKLLIDIEEIKQKLTQNGDYTYVLQSDGNYCLIDRRSESNFLIIYNMSSLVGREREGNFIQTSPLSCDIADDESTILEKLKNMNKVYTYVLQNNEKCSLIRQRVAGGSMRLVAQDISLEMAKKNAYKHSVVASYTFIQNPRLTSEV